MTSAQAHLVNLHTDTWNGKTRQAVGTSIGTGSRIGEGSTIGPRVTIGPRTSIGNGTGLDTDTQTGRACRIGDAGRMAAAGGTAEFTAQSAEFTARDREIHGAPRGAQCGSTGDFLTHVISAQGQTADNQEQAKREALPCGDRPENQRAPGLGDISFPAHAGIDRSAGW